MKLLIVEDEQKIAAALKRGLEAEHFAIDVEYTGPTGLAAAVDPSYDLVILDRMLPGIADGSQICQAMRQAGLHTPVLMLTAKDSIPDRVAGLEGGADDYLIKPFAFDELLARIRALLRRPAEQLGEELVVADLTLNPTTYEVKRAGQPIQLSSKEFALLEYFIRHKNRVLTKSMIISHVWDFDADVLPNTVEVYIGYLRNKIDRPESQAPLIHTVRGFGYRIGSA